MFLYHFVSETLFGEVSRNQLEIYMNYFHEETRTEPGGHLQGGTHRGQMVVSLPCTPLLRSCELPIMIKIILCNCYMIVFAWIR